MQRLLQNTLRLFAAALPLLTVACNEDPKNKEPSSTPAQSKTELIFPDHLRVGDAAVNTFVQSALTQCAKSDYEAFRALWTAKQKPISRAEFNEGWDAVRRIEVRALEKVLLATGDDPKSTEPVYVLLAEVELDAAARVGKREPLREIVLMLVPEHDQWKLAGAPKDMRDWVKERLGKSSPDGAPAVAAPSTQAP